MHNKKVALAAAGLVILAIVAASFFASGIILGTLASPVLVNGDNDNGNHGNPPPWAPAWGPQPSLGRGHDPAGSSMRIPF